MGFTAVYNLQHMMGAMDAFKLWWFSHGFHINAVELFSKTLKYASKFKEFLQLWWVQGVPLSLWWFIHGIDINVVELSQNPTKWHQLKSLVPL